jgi:DNA-binding NarL/FixJ family response regulator
MAAAGGLSLVTTTTRGSDGNHVERLTLLIADDDPVVSSMLSTGLAEAFEIVSVVADAEAAVDAARGRTPDAAVVDVNMPAGGGARAVRGIATVSPRTAVVVLSSDEEESVVRELLQSGAMTYCRKGIAVSDLANLIERSVAASRLSLAG